MQRADDRRAARSSKNVTHGEARRQCVGIGIVVQQDEHAIGVGEVALILLHTSARQRPAQLRCERSGDKFGKIEVRDLRHDRAKLVHVLLGVGPCANLQDVEQRPAGVADRRDHPLQSSGGRRLQR